MSDTESKTPRVYTANPVSPANVAVKTLPPYPPYPEIPDVSPRIRLIAVDLDDTLLTSNHIITQRTKDAIQEARGRGIIFTFATGRMFLSALPYAIELGLDAPLITYLGAYICSVGERPRSHLTIDRRTCVDVLNFLKPRGLQINVYIGDSFYVEHLTPQVEKYRNTIGAQCFETPDLVKLFDEFPQGATKIGIMTDAELGPVIYEELQSRFGDILSIIPSKPTFTELSRPDTGKGVALAAMAAELNISPEHIMAIGDSPNDEDMIEYAGWGIVMANGDENLKRKARWVTASNDEDGVAIAIERLALGQNV